MNILKKNEIIIKLNDITSLLEGGLVLAKVNSTQHSTEIRDQLAYEVGYLSGLIKSTISELKDIK
jgi:hypothetical protein